MAEPLCGYGVRVLIFLVTRNSSLGPASAGRIDWLTIPDNEQSVVEDVQRIRSHPLVPDDIPIYGYIYDVKSGKLNEVKEATKAGKAK
ncbi:MAG: hypothetical protein U5J94_06660 [Thiohalophilus sp.]|nr:hypothetical protein [Thiohalophilus sp.]MDZ7662054.1 hypothetical protein [Thiohalophilus sp.]